MSGKTPTRTVFIGDIPYDFLDVDVRKVVESATIPPLEVRLVWDKERNRHKGYGFLEYQSIEDAIAAKHALSGLQVKNRKLRADFSDIKSGGQQQQQQQQQQMPMPVQMQPVPMQLTPSNSTDLTAASSSNMQQQNSGGDRFSTLLKSYSGPVAGVPFNPNYMFTTESAQDSINTLNSFLSQLSHEQTRQISEGLQTYSLQNSGPYSAPFMGQKNAGHSHPGFNSAANDPMFNVGNQHNPLSAVEVNGGGQFVNHPSIGRIAASNNRLDIRRGSLPISSNGDLFTAPSSSTAHASIAAHHQANGNGLMTGSELDPLLFNPMTPFLQELQLFNSATLAGVGLNPNQQRSMGGGGGNMVSVGPAVSGSSSLHDSGTTNTTSHTSSSS